MKGTLRLHVAHKYAKIVDRAGYHSQVVLLWESSPCDPFCIGLIATIIRHLECLNICENKHTAAVSTRASRQSHNIR
jgi:hypothetical protein